MTPYKQLFKHDPDNGEYGDCYRTAIGCLLDLPPDRVPHFAIANGPHTTGEESFEAAKRFLSKLGVISVYLALSEVTTREEALAKTAKIWPGIHLIFGGTSDCGTPHVVIVKDGIIVHDPSKSNSGIVGPLDDGSFVVEILARPLEGVEGR